MIDNERLLNTFLSLIRIDSPSGQEAAIGVELAHRLKALGLEVHVDETGNVLGRLEGEGEPLLLSAHMDTVPGVGIQPVVNDGLVCSDGTTILGADDKSGLAVILEVLETLRANGVHARARGRFERRRRGGAARGQGDGSGLVPGQAGVGPGHGWADPRGRAGCARVGQV